MVKRLESIAKRVEERPPFLFFTLSLLKANEERELVLGGDLEGCSSLQLVEAGDMGRGRRTTSFLS